MAAKRVWLQESEKASVGSKVRFRSFAVILALTFFAGNLATARAADSDAYLFARHDAASIMRSADVGNPEAQTHLGYLYYKGRGVPQDYEAAAYWLTRAAEQGEPTAQFLLGLLYDKGQGVEQ